MHTMTTTKNVKPKWEKKMQIKRDKLAMKVCPYPEFEITNRAIDEIVILNSKVLRQLLEFSLEQISF